MAPLPPPEIRVLVVDRHEAVAAALATMLGQLPDVEVAGVASSVGSAVSIAETDDAIDVAVVDTELADGPGLELCRRLRAANGAIRCILHVAGAEPHPVSSTDHPVDAVVAKQLVGDDLVRAIRSGRS